MKKSTKALLLSLCAIALVAASVMGTLAYLTSEAEVINTFTVGNVAITMDETNVDTNGVPLTGAQAGRGTANTYKLIPGQSYTKDPVVHVSAGSEDCWLFVKVENELTAIEDSTNTISAQMTANGWAQIGAANVYAYSSKQSELADIAVFESFKVAGTVDNTTLATYADKTVVVTAYAVQAEGFDTAAAAWNATFGASNG